MRKMLGLVLAIPLISAAGLAQNVGDHATSGFSNNRTFLNSDAGDFGPPLSLIETVPLTGVSSADSIIVFENFILVGEGGNPVTYTLFDRTDGSVVWTNTILGAEADLRYTPAYANDVVILGGPATSTVKAVRVSDGTVLWSDTTVGSSQGRHPAITSVTEVNGGLAVYHGRFSIAAANATTGAEFWRIETTTAQAPVSIAGGAAYVLQGGGTLQSVDIRTGNLNWAAGGFGGDGSNIIATEKYVFLNNPANNFIGAGRTTDGSGLWASGVPSQADPGIALAYDRLYAFFSQDGVAKVRAYNPDGVPDGAGGVLAEVLWETSDPALPAAAAAAQTVTPLPMFGLVANNIVYFYNTGTERIRALDAFTGTSLWSIEESDPVRGLTVADGLLFVLFDDEVKIYAPANQIFLAQIADGSGLSTLFALNALSGEETTGTLEFFAPDGTPLSLGLVGEAGSVSAIPFVIDGNGTVSFQSDGSRLIPTRGWARASADNPISGTAVFQFGDGSTFLFEAGVGNSSATGLASVFASRFETPGGNDFNTGVAIANVLDETATVMVEFRPAGGGATLGPVERVLEPGEQTAEFLNEFFDTIGTDATGTLVITSDIPVVITALRTQDGIQMSSYPVAQVVN